MGALLPIGWIILKSLNAKGEGFVEVVHSGNLTNRLVVWMG